MDYAASIHSQMLGVIVNPTGLVSVTVSYAKFNGTPNAVDISTLTKDYTSI